MTNPILSSEILHAPSGLFVAARGRDDDGAGDALAVADSSLISWASPKGYRRKLEGTPMMIILQPGAQEPTNLRQPMHV